MEDKITKQEKIPFYKKAIGVGILLAAAIYCIPELQKITVKIFDFIKYEWGKQR